MAQTKVTVPYSEPIPSPYKDNLVAGKVDVIIKGNLEFISRTDQQFTISLADGTTRENSKNIAISLQAIFWAIDDDITCKLVVLSYKKDGVDGQYCRIEAMTNISMGVDFTIVISVKNRTFGINVNDTPLLEDFDRCVDLKPINRLIVEGDNLTLYKPQYQVRQW